MRKLLALLSILAIVAVSTPHAHAQRGGRERGGFGGRGFGGGTGERIEPEDMEFSYGVAEIPDREMFEKLSYQGPDVMRDGYLANLEFVKFIVEDPGTEKCRVYFMNTENHRAHPPFMRMVGITGRGPVRGAITYLPRLGASDGTPGLYIYDFEPNDSYSFEEVRQVRDILVSKMPILKDRFSFHPLPGNVARYEREKELYEKSDVSVHLDKHLYSRIAYLPLNAATSFGRLRVMENEARPSPRDVVICSTLPNQMPRVAGVITEVRQTPLSHVNLRAVQDKVPNAYIDGALKLPEVKSLVGKLVRYEVTSQGYKLREATTEEVDQHFEHLRPAKPQLPERDLEVTDIKPLSKIDFALSTAFGVKTANLATMHTFSFPEGTVPDGYGIPFHFYHEFMAHNGFYDYIDELLQNPEFQGDRETQQRMLSQLRKKIEAGRMPEWMMTALAKVQQSFPEGTRIRCRSSTNSEDLPGFSGAGLYDSYTHKPDEGHLAKSIRQVFSSMWNFRAFEEREFHRIDHKQAAMGVLLHPSFQDERANGVAVTEDILYESQGNYYINTQVGEDLVTNPEADSSPEETLLGWWERDGHEIVRHSAAVADDTQVLSDEHLSQLRKHLARIHARFAGLYGRSAEDLKFAMEIEFKITRNNQLVIKQARPWVF